jgi:hypothetical protein
MEVVYMKNVKSNSLVQSVLVPTVLVQSLLAQSLLIQSFLAIAAAAVVLPAVVASPAHAQANAPDNLTFLGEVNADSTFLRTGPANDNNNYPVYKLDKGSRVVVVGIRNDWLQVVPPEGAFCVIDKRDIERRGADVGRITRNDGALFRMGSTIVPSRYKISPSRLETGSDVKIVGEEAEFFKIAPPQGVYFWVERASVTPVKRLNANEPAAPNQGNPAQANPAQANPTQANPPQASPTQANPVDPAQPPATNPPANPGDRFVATSDPNTAPGAPDAVEPANPPAAQGDPNAAAANAVNAAPAPVNNGVREIQDKLAKLENDYAAASKLPIVEQPVDQLIAGYTELANNPAVPPNAKQVVDFRLKALLVRKDALEQFKAVEQIRSEMTTKQTALQGEEKELRDRVEATKIVRYTALGNLMSSSLQVGSQTLYRLVDPVTGRTVVYLRSNDPNISAAMGKFVGVSGEVITDDQINLTYVTPTKIEQVDPANVNVRVFAEFTPPSMLATNIQPVGETAPVAPAPADAPTDGEQK